MTNYQLPPTPYVPPILSLGQSGQALIIVMIVMGLIIVNTLLIITGSVTYLQSTKYDIEKTQATDLAEAGIDKAVASLNATGGSYNGEGNGISGTQLGNGEYSVSVNNVNSQTKKITVTGYVPNKATPIAKKTVSIQLSRGLGFAFNYGLQAGDGGLTMANNAKVNGSVYSNGSINMGNNANITGDVYVAGGVQANPNQQNDCSPPNCQDQIFGKTSSVLDAGQSFVPGSSQNPDTLRKLTVKLKKVGNPPDLTVKILGDFSTNHDSPNKGDIHGTGFVSASLVGSQYSFVDVTLTSLPPVVQNGFTYWVVLIPQAADNNNYWVWGEDSLNSYSPGRGMTTVNWNPSHGNPTWSNLSPPGDLGFKIYFGGAPDFILGTNNSLVGGDVHANTVGNLNVTGNLYYQIVNPPASVTVGKTQYPGSADPASQSLPISDANIQDWQTQAQAAGVHAGFVGCPTSMNGKYTGDVSFSVNCNNVKIFSPVWITGNVILSNNNTFKLDSSYGGGSGVIVVDGETTAGGNDKFSGTGTTGSYLMVVSNWNSTATGPNPGSHAITFGNNGNSGIFYANKGLIRVANNNSLTEMTAWQLILDNNVTITYDQGLAGAFFSSGPSGSFTAIKGSYQIK